MKDIGKSEFERDLKHSLRRMWLIAVVVAVASAIPLAYFEHTKPWVIAVPIALGVLLGLVFEVRDDLRRYAETKNLAATLQKQQRVAQTKFPEPHRRRIYVAEGRRVVINASIVIGPRGEYAERPDAREIARQATEAGARSFSDVRLVGSEA
jgi:hypothetical protein